VTQFSVVTNTNKALAPKTWILFAFEKEEGFFNAAAKVGKSIWKQIKDEGFSGKDAQAAVAHPPAGSGADRLIALGLGPKRDVSLESLRRAGGRLARKAREVRVENAIVEWPRQFKDEQVKAFVEGVLLGSYQFNRYKTQVKDAPKGLQKFIFKVPADLVSATTKAIQTAESYAEGVILARDLINGAPSDVTPKVLADTAVKIAKGPIRLKLYTKKDLIKMGAGGLLGVNIGSALDPYLIHLHYKPAGKAKKSVAIVGKGITFDSGGLSLKPAGAMETMKMDMAGAAAVLGVFSQLSKLKPNVEVHGIIATTENMPGGRAYKPGDVLKAMNGKTMEVLNTDAEGRLVLADALSYAVQQKVDGIVDMATLTGACIVALGSLVTGAMTNDPKLLEQVKKATDTEGERIWELPLVKEYRDDIKSKIADMKNIGSAGKAGSIIGGLFLEEFVGKTPWVHLDIAGPAWMDSEVPSMPYLTHGGTGLMVRSLLTLFRTS
jgi:leucyl aminopeptidase